ncbi:MAG: hypothetical protein AAF529_23070, partial [Pseudomonadota bacterium]
SYRITVENSGDVNLENLNVTEDLATVFADAAGFTVTTLTSTTLTINAGFDGNADTGLLDGTDTLAVGATATIELTLNITPGADLGPYLNTVVANASTPAGAPISDDSVDGSDPDPDANGDPGDNAGGTPVTFTEAAMLGIAKAVSASTPNFDGTFTTTFTLVVENSGDVIVNNVIVSDDVAAQIAPATVEEVTNVTIAGALSALDPAFDGVGNINLTDGSEALAVGAAATISFDLRYRPNDNLGPFSNVANVGGESPANPTPGTPNITDGSTPGATPDPDGNGDPTDNNDVTPITFEAGTDGVVTITEESVPGEVLDISVSDADENFDPNTVESFTVTVRNDTTGETETITVVETGPDTGVFTSTLPTTFGTSAGGNDDGTLNTQLDDTVTVIYNDRLTATGAALERTDTGVVIGFATIEGNAWLDADIDDSFDAGETPLQDWIIRVEQNGVLIAEVPVNPDGSYSVPDLLPGDGYTVSLAHPDTGVTFGTIDDISLQPELTVLDQNLPIDPSGVFYDSVSRQPLADITVTMVNSSGTPLPDACLLPNQQNQTTSDDGLYRFDILTDADPACPSGETFMLTFSTPPGYNPGLSALLPPLAGPIDPTGLGDPVRVGDASTAPTLAESTDYYLSFTLETGDPDVVFNHIPLDPVGVGGFSVRLTKEVNQRTTSIGGLVSYTITLENLSPVFLPGVSVVDTLPPGFSYVENSAQLDGNQTGLTVSGTRPVTFAGIDLPAGERRTLRYILRVGVGLAHGEYINTATPFVGPAPIGNSDSARIVLVADPDFEQTTVIGKVWHDRDADGWQDTAAATDVRVTVHLASSATPKQTLLKQGQQAARATTDPAQGVSIEHLPGRYGLADESAAYLALLRSTYDTPVQVDRIEVSSAEGSRQTFYADGRVVEEHRGKVQAGLVSQDLQVKTRTHKVADGYELVVELHNRGYDEPGLPGVRLATVSGLLVETDAFGRYHIAGVDAGFIERGRNFIVKVDPATLPENATFTTENPRVKRLSQGLMNRFDFGVGLPELRAPEQRIKVKIAEMFFKPGSAEVLPGYMSALEALAKRLKQGDFVTLTLTAYVDSENPNAAARTLAEQRAVALRQALCDLLGHDVNAQIETRIETINTPSLSSLVPDHLQFLNNVFDFLAQLLIPSAHADCAALQCQADATDGAFVVEDIVVEEANSSVFPDLHTLVDQGRVDLVGETSTRLADGGVIWWTEDPAGLTPVLAIQAPSHLPVRQGRYETDAEFLIYSNYAHFIDEMIIEVFAENDTDRRTPLDVFIIDTSD